MPDEPTYFYYAGDQQVPLDLVEDTVAVGFSDPISARRLDQLRASDRSVDILGQSPALLERKILIYRVGSASQGAERLRAFAERLRHGGTVRFVSFVFYQPDTGLYVIPTDEIAVSFKPGVSDEQIDALNAQLGAEAIEQELHAPTQYLVRVLDMAPAGALDVANAYYRSGLVEWAEPNFVTETHLDFLDRQWHLNNTGQHYLGAPGAPPKAAGVEREDVRATAVWAITRGSPDVVIAILDSGVDITHPDLSANIDPNGRNFVDPSNFNNPNPGPDTNQNGRNAHGTKCAGVAAGAGIRTSGIAPRCKILPIRIFGSTASDKARAIRYAAEHAQILSNSYNTAPSGQVDQAIRDVTSVGRGGKGTIVLFSAGNNNQAIQIGPKRVPGVIVVGASTNVGSRAGYSNVGDDREDAPTHKRLSVVACSSGTSANAPFLQTFPADGSTEDIYTTDIQGAGGSNPQPTNLVGNVLPEPNVDASSVAHFPDYTGLFGGTSAACPLAAGICALMLSINPNLTRPQVQYILEATADKIGTGQHRVSVPDGKPPAGQTASYNPATGYDLFPQSGGPNISRYGFGRVNAEQAVRAAQGKPIRQLVGAPAGAAYQDAIPVKLHRRTGTNEFVSGDLELAEARRDPHVLSPTNPTAVRAAPGGFIRATFQPPGGAPPITDEVDVAGQPS